MNSGSPEVNYKEYRFAVIGPALGIVLLTALMILCAKDYPWFSTFWLLLDLWLVPYTLINRKNRRIRLYDDGRILDFDRRGQLRLENNMNEIRKVYRSEESAALVFLNGTMELTWIERRIELEDFAENAIKKRLPQENP
jgi:hypothetical protein